MQINTKPEIAIYIHWPFCESKCPYCDFNSHVSKIIDQESWKKRYLSEIYLYKNLISYYKIRSIFFGGGTPSLMNPDIISKILELINKFSNIDKAEITLEANPTSFEVNKFKDFKLAGINRVSIGTQSFNDKNLVFLGRNHDSKLALYAIENAANIFSNYSFDLIYALPGQEVNDWMQELEFSVSLQSPHISLYQLTIEDNTKFAAQYKAKRFSLPSNDIANQMYLHTNKFLKKNGYLHYEISNYAKKGFESRHNLAYWEYLPYIGIGPGAHGRLHFDKAILRLDADLDKKLYLNGTLDLDSNKHFTKDLFLNSELNVSNSNLKLYLENNISESQYDFNLQNDLKNIKNITLNEDQNINNNYVFDFSLFKNNNEKYNNKAEVTYDNNNQIINNVNHNLTKQESKNINVVTTFAVKNPKIWLESQPLEHNTSETLNKIAIFQEIVLMSMRINKGINLQYLFELTKINLLILMQQSINFNIYKKMFKISKNKKYLQIKQKYRHITDYLIAKILDLINNTNLNI